jgi:hypothetical protein
MKSVFNTADTAELAARINKLTPVTPPQWGKMNVSQMLAHCNVTYEMVFEDKHPKPSFFMKLVLTAFVKKKVTTDVPYKPGLPTAPQFLIKDEKDFEAEKNRLIGHIDKTQQLGEAHFDGKESHSFGRLNKTEWNNMFYKHLDHHLRQFGV